MTSKERIKMKLGISEILKMASEQKNKEDQIIIIQNNDSVPLRTILVAALDPSVKWLLPEGKVPYKPNQYLDQENQLYNEYRKLYLFLDGGHDHLKQPKRESLFISLLESINQQDAELLVSIKDKKLPFKNITPELINAAFPGLLTIVDKPEKKMKTKNIVAV